MTSTAPPTLNCGTRQEALLPLAQFDRQSLKQHPAHVTSALADGYLDLMLAKACAGLRPKLRMGGADMRQAFMLGQFNGSARRCWAWAFSGLKDRQIPELHAVCALTIYELARGMETVFGEYAGGLAGYLNQWARDPERAMPTCEDLFVSCPINIAPSAALSIRPGHPDRQDRPADSNCRSYSILRLGDLNYVLDTQQLNAWQHSGLPRFDSVARCPLRAPAPCAIEARSAEQLRDDRRAPPEHAPRATEALPLKKSEMP